MKNKIYWCPEVCICTQKSTRIWKVYLNYSKCTWKVSILLYKHHAIIESRATRHSAVSAFTEIVEFLERSLVSIILINDKIFPLQVITYFTFYLYFCSWHHWFAKTQSYLQLSYQITDRLLAGGNIKRKKQNALHGVFQEMLDTNKIWRTLFILGCFHICK